MYERKVRTSFIGQLFHQAISLLLYILGIQLFKISDGVGLGLFGFWMGGQLGDISSVV